MGESRELNCCCFSTFIFIDRTLLDPGVRVRTSVSSSPRSGSKGTESIDHGKLDDTRRPVHTWEQPSGEQRLSVQTASSVDAQYLIEKVIRARIYDSLYWKEHCFALNGAYQIAMFLRYRYRTFLARGADAQPNRSSTKRLRSRR